MEPFSFNKYASLCFMTPSSTHNEQSLDQIHSKFIHLITQFYIYISQLDNTTVSWLLLSLIL